VSDCHPKFELGDFRISLDCFNGLKKLADVNTVDGFGFLVVGFHFFYPFLLPIKMSASGLIKLSFSASVLRLITVIFTH